MMLSNYYQSVSNPYRAMDLNYLPHYNVFGIPIMAYAFVGATTILLAAVTLLESGSSEDGNSGESLYESFTSKLPAFSSESSNNDNSTNFNTSDFTSPIKDAYNNTMNTLDDLDDRAKDTFNFKTGGGKRKSKSNKKSKSRKTKRQSKK